MRLDGFFPVVQPYDRSAPRGGAPVPYRDSEKAAEKAYQAGIAPGGAIESSYDHLARVRAGEAVERSARTPADYMPARFEALMERPLSSRAALALQSYSMTSSFTADIEAHEVLGLDIYV